MGDILKFEVWKSQLRESCAKDEKLVRAQYSWELRSLTALRAGR
jgi:hypothetical protein